VSVLCPLPASALLVEGFSLSSFPPLLLRRRPNIQHGRSCIQSRSFFPHRHSTCCS